MNYNVPVVVVRLTADGENRFDAKAIIDADTIFLPVDADIEEGDRVEQQLPNGKRRVLRITKVDVLQSPFGTPALDHTEAHFTTALTPPPSSRGGDVFNVRATNVQVATGDRSHQTMTIGQTADQLVLVIKGISELLVTLNLAQGRESELTEVRDDAIDDIVSDEPTIAGVRRFYEWTLGCVKTGGTAAVGAAVTAASNGLLHDAEALVHALGG